MTVYDYVIVGAGSAGCVLADRLTADGRTSVLLIEAGGTDRRDPRLHVPKGFAFTLGNPKYCWAGSVEPFGPFDQTENWLSGKGLGGSSAINGMVYNRGFQADYDNLVELGNPGWGWDEILRIYKQLEDHGLGASDTRGVGGPLKVGVSADTEELSERIMESAGKIGLHRVDDINASDAERIGYTPASIHRGLRQSSAKAFLHPAMKRPNLTVRLNVVVDKVLFEGDDAVGVTGTVDGSSVEVRASREVILSAGSFGSPQLLQRSGIGPKNVLTAAGIETRLDRSKVGEGLREHRAFPLQVRIKRDIGYNKALASPFAQALTGAKYLVTRRGPVSTPAIDMLAFIKTTPDVERPDAQLLIWPLSQGVGNNEFRVERRPGFTIMGFVLRPTSLGSTHVVSPDPLVPPQVDFGYLTSDYDREVSIGMFRRMREIVQQSPIAEDVQVEIQPGEVVQNDEQILNSGFLYGGPGYHASGACAMGPQEDAVVDSRLRVRGVNRLRVIDVSVLPSMVSGNLNGPMMAMAWRAAEFIRAGE